MTDQEIITTNMMIALIVLGVLSATNAQLMGGWSELKNQTTIQIMSSFAMSALTAQSGGNMDYSGCKVTHSAKQLVAGMNYRFIMHCGNEVCDVTVYDVPWMNSRELSAHKCTQHQARVGGIIAGGVSSGCPDDKTIEAAMPTILQGIDMRTNSVYKTMPVTQTVTDCTKQVVAGMKYTFTVTVHYSSCMKGDAGSTLSDCPITDTQLPDQKMRVSIISQPWMHPQFTLLSAEPVIVVQKSHKKHGHKKTGHDNKLKFQAKGHKVILGGDNHDLIHHGRHHKKIQHHLFGGDMHDMVHHGKKPLLGGDGHDMVHHGKKLLFGGDGRDMVYHGKKPLLGGDGHDMIHHGKNPLLGGDGHDMVHHGKKPLLGGDGHDMIHHGKKPLLGRDGHDMIHHGKKPLLGGDGHDMIHHGKKLLFGGDGHDMIHHEKKPLLGGDGHDMVHHGKKPLLGGDGHDMIHHGKNPLFGGDGHDMIYHGKKPLLGGDGHDMIHHGKKPLLGGDGHDMKTHGRGRKNQNLRLFGEFKAFQKKYNKQYKSKKEQKYRFKVFLKNMRKVKKIQQTEKGTAVYGATQFADLTANEFKQYVGKRWDINAKSFVEMERAHVSTQSVPEAFDWRDHGAVTPVKNQGSCGSCWAFSTTGNIEGQWAIKKGNLLSLSEQELVDCDKVDEGCNGGLPSNAYKEIRRLGGLETESQYKYDGRDEKCAFKKSKVRAYINGSVSISSDEKEMAAWLAENGPISIGINAFAMQFYMGGISYPWRIFCNPKNLDHGVLIVGYGVEGSKPYWIIKNSWGESWGEKGYYRAYRGAGVCGLNTMCTSSVVN